MQPAQRRHLMLYPQYVRVNLINEVHPQGG